MTPPQPDDPPAAEAVSGAAPILDVLVVGAGQAGLSTGYWLSRHGLSFEILDSAPMLGQSWRNRWDSLTLLPLDASAACRDYGSQQARGGTRPASRW